MKLTEFVFAAPGQAITRRLCAAFFFAVALAGCASTGPSGEQAASNLESALKEADAEIAGGQHDKALAILQQAAKEHPTSATPWLQIAHIWFDKGNYPSSILAASEALQRDAASQSAKSLLVVAGLRVSAEAVNGLRPNGPVSVNTRAEAEHLTQSLRNALGEKELVPSADEKSAKPFTRSRSKAKPVRVPVVRPATSNAAATDPFKSLK